MKSDFKVDYFASTCRQWHEVVRVNAQSLTLPYLWAPTPAMRCDDLNSRVNWKLPCNEVSGKTVALERTEQGTQCGVAGTGRRVLTDPGSASGLRR